MYQSDWSLMMNNCMVFFFFLFCSLEIRAIQVIPALVLQVDAPVVDGAEGLRMRMVYSRFWKTHEQARHAGTRKGGENKGKRFRSFVSNKRCLVVASNTRNFFCSCWHFLGGMPEIWEHDILAKLQAGKREGQVKKRSRY